MVYKGEDLQLIIFTCYSWDMALNVALGGSFDKFANRRESGERRGS
jgi:hypothetical protein